MMDKIREVRRGSMAPVNGSLSRRRQRGSNLRDSPDEDGAVEMHETSRLRDRGVKKDRDRDRSGRNKRRKGERLLHGSHREEGEDSSEESVDEDDDDDEEDSSVAVRLPPPPTPSVSGIQSNNLRKGYPVRPLRPPGTGTWKVVEEMIGAPIPRKARTSSVKRSLECWVSGGGGICSSGVGAEHAPRQASMSPARPSPSSTTPVSPTSSNVSVRKKTKPISLPKQRPLKSSKSSSIQEIEIEVAEVLFGMTRHVPQKLDDLRHDPKDSNGSSNEIKSRVSSPIPISPPTSQPSTSRPFNQSLNTFPLTATAPKRKRPRMRFDEESPTSPPSSTVLPSASCSSTAKLDAEAVTQLLGTKTDTSSPRSEKIPSPVLENGGVSNDPSTYNISPELVFSAKVQNDFIKAEHILDLKDAESQPEKRNKEESFSSPKDSPSPTLDAMVEETSASKSAIISDSQREDNKFSIDLMALPGKLSPETNSDYLLVCKPPDTVNALKTEIYRLKEEKIEKKVMEPASDEIVSIVKNGGMPSIEDSNSRKQAAKERNLDLHLDLEKLDRDDQGSVKHHAQKQQSNKAPKADPKNEKAGPMPLQIAGWPGGFPPFGFIGQVPPLPPIVPVDGNSASSKQNFPPSQLRPKRCAAHCYIAQNIHYHQQITRLNPFWPSATSAVAPFYGSNKQYNLSTASAPPLDSAILGAPLPGSLGKSMGSVQEKGMPASSAGHSVKDKSNAVSPLVELSQRKQPSSQPGSAGNMLAPAFIFPLNQQQAVAAAANRSGVAKLSASSGSTAQSSGSGGYASVGVSGTNGSGATMSFNYPGLPPNEAQYLAFLQSNAYSFPIPGHVGGTPPYRGASPAQAMPFFNLSFYPSQMLHPPQLRLPPPSQQTPFPHQGHQNPSTSSGSSSSQKNTQQTQRLTAAATSATTSGSPHVFSSSKQHHLPLQARQLDSELGGEDAPSSADSSRVSQAQKNIYNQKFTIPNLPQNFALVAPPVATLSNGAGNPSEKQQLSQNHAMKVDLSPSQAYAMSFASGGAVPHGLDFSSLMHNHALFQNLPEAARHGYQVSAAAAHSSQQNRKFEDGKPTTELNGATIVDEAKISSSSKSLGAQQHSLTFSRSEAESPISSILTNNVIDGSSRTLNLTQPPNGAPPRVSGRPASAAPASNSPHQLPQHHQQHVLQLQKQHQQLQLQQQLQQQQRAKSASLGGSTLYADRLPSNSVASKFAQGLANFPPALIQNNPSLQTPQWKASTRAPNPAPSTSLTASVSSSLKNQIPMQPQVRSQPPMPAHQPHQISFGVSHNKPAASGTSTATILAGSPQNSVSKSSGGSPRSSSTMAKSATPPAVMPTLPFQKQQSVKSSSPSSAISSLPAASSRNMPSILGNPHISTPNLGSKPQPKQHSPQAQLFFSYPYMQAQTSPSDAAAAAAGYFQQHLRRPSDLQHQSLPRTNSTPASTGLLSLGSSPLSVSTTISACVSLPLDPSKAIGTAALSNSSKNPTSVTLLQHPSSGGAIASAHPLMYMHSVQTAPLKPDVSAAATAAEQKPSAGR